MLFSKKEKMARSKKNKASYEKRQTYTFLKFFFFYFHCKCKFGSSRIEKIGTEIINKVCTSQCDFQISFIKNNFQCF